MENYVAKCLVARPSVQDPFFKNSVVFVFEQNDIQTTGVVVNRKSNFNTQDLLAKVGAAVPKGVEPVYAGGPVSKNSIIMLHTKEWHSTSTFRVGGKYAVTSDDLMLKRFAMGDAPRGYKFCAGVAVWHNQQLQNEIRAASWLCVELNKHTVFDYNGMTQWDLAIEHAAKQTIDQFF